MIVSLHPLILSASALGKLKGDLGNQFGEGRSFCVCDATFSGFDNTLRVAADTEGGADAQAGRGAVHT